jgi:hypothetical protein
VEFLNFELFQSTGANIMSIRSQVNTTNQKISPIQTTSTFPSADKYLDACDKFDAYFAEISAKWKKQIAAAESMTTHH